MQKKLDGEGKHVKADMSKFDREGRYKRVGAGESADGKYRSRIYFTEVPDGSGTCVGDDGTPASATYESWWGYDSLPKMRANDAQVRALIWDNATAPETTVAGHWMQFADGWRLDVGGDVDPGTITDPTNDYWEGFRNTVKAVNPEAYITGEEWGIANSWLLGGEWDAVMNYQFSTAALSYWRDEAFNDNDHNSGSSAGPLNPLTPQQFDNRIQNLMERYAPEALAAMLNLFGSHDTSRALFMLDHNADLNDPTLYENPNYDWSDAIMRLKGAVIIQMTMPGATTIYYGDEVGLVGPMAYSGGKWEDDPYNRQPYPWLDESGTPFYTRLQSQANQDALYNYYALLTAARNAHPALRTGEYRTLLVDNDAKLYASGRLLEGSDAALGILIRDTTAQLVTLDVAGYLPIGAQFNDVLSGSNYTVGAGGSLVDVNVPANSGAVLVLNGALASPPDAVIDLAMSGTGNASVDLAWSAITGADAYRVYRSLLTGGGYELLGETAATTYHDSGMANARMYYYVVTAVHTATGLESDLSNEVSAMPALHIDWANLQWPYSITHTIGITPTENIYGQVYIDGATAAAGQTPGLLAQVGFGAPDTAPNGWMNWVDATFNSQTGNNDEFKGTLLPEATGTYDYVYRYSTTNGTSWVYADGTGLIDGAIPAP